MRLPRYKAVRDTQTERVKGCYHGNGDVLRTSGFLQLERVLSQCFVSPATASHCFIPCHPRGSARRRTRRTPRREGFASSASTAPPPRLRLRLPRSAAAGLGHRSASPLSKGCGTPSDAERGSGPAQEHVPPDAASLWPRAGERRSGQLPAGAAPPPRGALLSLLGNVLSGFGHYLLQNTATSTITTTTTTTSSPPPPPPASSGACSHGSAPPAPPLPPPPPQRRHRNRRGSLASPPLPPPPAPPAAQPHSRWGAFAARAARHHARRSPLELDREDVPFEWVIEDTSCRSGECDIVGGVGSATFFKVRN
ncbi:Protein of unknown function [Gryllus bimaculatus]|nr:Protein of unknown function [Gryllus bimaculatus]